MIHARKGVNTNNLGSLFGMLDGSKMFLDCDIFWSADNIIITQNSWFHHHLAQRHSSRPSLANCISEMSSVKNFSFGWWQLQHLKVMSNSLDLKKPTEAVRSTNYTGTAKQMQSLHLSSYWENCLTLVTFHKIMFKLCQTSILYTVHAHIRTIPICTKYHKISRNKRRNIHISIQYHSIICVLTYAFVQNLFGNLCAKLPS